MDMASVTQKIAIMMETAAALMASGFIPIGGSIEIRMKKEINPKLKPTICFLLISLPLLQKDIWKQMEQGCNCHVQLQEPL